MSALKKTKARSVGRRRFLGKARANWLYTQPEVQKLFGVCPNTIRNWRRNGLRSFKANVRLFLGRDLNAFHKRRYEDAKRPCAPGEVYCVCCKQKHSLREVPYLLDSKSRFRTRVLITCPATGGTSATYIRETDLTSLTQQLNHNSSRVSDD
ncbi:helix-turn-helix domain-containing protein [Roseibium sp. Sym1]|uniref:helix-turn-helix domain-containing protein n=1 Tax=Roseibium sp. Sym1 TaxID=3016006 RepID=UPI0022B48693|nr:helix-turn-helix domain-containing protein [Roseibium sp. Sym1]